MSVSRRLLGLSTLGITNSMAPFAPRAGGNGDSSFRLPSLQIGIPAWGVLPSSVFLLLVLKWPELLTEQPPCQPSSCQSTPSLTVSFSRTLEEAGLL